MGNTANKGEDGTAALILVDRPLIQDLSPNEYVIARIEVQDEVYNINDWPAQPIAVDPPRGMLRCTFWAVAEDDEDEQRECGEIVLSNECVEQYEESAFSVWLNLMEPGKVPTRGLTGREVNQLFNACFEDATNVLTSKVCITIALVDIGLLTDPNQEEDIYDLVVRDRPVMQLLAHSSDIIREYYNAYTMYQHDVEMANRDFASKEKLYQGFVVSARTQKIQMTDRFKNSNKGVANKWEELMNNSTRRAAFDRWRDVLAEIQERRLNEKIKKKMAQMEWIGQKMQGLLRGTDKPKGCKFHELLFASWKITMERERKVDHFIMQLFNNRKGILDMFFHTWHEVVVMMEVNQLKADNFVFMKVGISFKIRSMSLARAPDKLLVELEAGIRQCLLTVMETNAKRPQPPRPGTWKLDDNWQTKPLESKHVKIILNKKSEGDGDAECIIALPQGRSLQSVRASLGTAPELEKELTAKLNSIPGVVRITTGNGKPTAYDLQIYTLRERKEQEFKADKSASIMKALEKSFANERLLVQLDALHAWRQALDIVRQEAEAARAEQFRQEMADQLKKEHEEELKKTRLAMVEMWGDKHEELKMKAIFYSWQDLITQRKDARRHAGTRAEAISSVLFDGTKRFEMHTYFRCWKEFVVAEQMLKDKGMSMRAMDHKYDAFLERSLLCWGEHDEDIQKHCVFRSWKEGIIQAREDAKRAAMLVRHREAEEEKNRRINTCLMSMEENNKDFFQKLYFDAWKDVLEDRKYMAKLGYVTDDAERLRALHKNDVAKLITQTTDATNLAFFHVVFSTWAMYLQKLKDMENNKKLLKLTENERSRRVEAALNKWADSGQALQLHTVMHAWFRTVTELMLERERADQLAREQMVMDLHDQKMKYVLAQMESSNVSFLRSLYFESWKDMLEEARLCKENTGLAGETARLKKWHQSAMHSILEKTASVDSTTLKHIVVGGWKELLWEAQRRKAIDQHLKEQREMHDMSIDKAMFLWGTHQDSDVSLHMVVLCWHKELLMKKQMMEKERHDAMRSEAKAKYEGTVTSVLMNLHEERNDFLIMGYFRCWKDTVQEKKTYGKIREMHTAKVQTALRRTAGETRVMTLHICFAGWRDCVMKDKAMTEIMNNHDKVKGHLDQRIDQALLLWGDHHQHVFLHTVLHIWHESVRDWLEKDRIATDHAREAAAKDRYISKAGAAILTISEQNDQAYKMFIFREWKDVIHAKQLDAQAERYKKMHTESVQGILQTTCEGNDTIFMHGLFGAWKEEWWQARQTRKIAEHVGSVEEKHAHNMDKTILRWGSDQQDVFLHTIMHIWHEEVVDAIELQKEADRLAKEAKAKEEYTARVGVAVNFMSGDNSEFMRLSLFRAWKDLWEDTHLDGVVNLERRRFRALNSDNVQDALRRTAEGDNTIYLHIVYAAWKEHVLDLRRLRHIAEHLDEQKDKHAIFMDKSLELWGSEERDVFLHSMLHIWKESARGTKEQREEMERQGHLAAIKEAHEQKMTSAMILMKDGDMAFLKQSLFHAWKEVYEDAHNKSESARYKKLYSSNVQVSLNQMAESDERTFVHTIFAAWKEMRWQNHRSREHQEHLDSLKESHDRVMDKALLLWADHHQDVAMHTIIHAWREDVTNWLFQQAEENRRAREAAVKEFYDDSVLSVILKMESENDSVLLLAYWREWKDQYQDAHMKGVKAQYRKLHSETTQEILMRTCAVDDQTYTHMLFAAWKDHIFDVRTMVKIKEHLSSTKEEHNHSMDRALALWGDSSKEIVLHTIMHAWHEDIIDYRFQTMEADRLARERAAKEKYEYHVSGVLCMMEDDNTTFLLTMIFRNWLDMYQDAKVTGQQAQFRKLHSESTQKILAQVADVDEQTFLHVVFAAWKEHQWELKRIRHITEHLEVAEERHAHSMDRAMMLWGDTNQDVFLHSVLHIWYEDWKADKEAAEDADRLAREQKAQEIYDQRVGGVLLLMEGDNADFQMMYYFRQWHDYFVDQKATGRHAFFKKLHSGQMQMTLLRTCDSDDNVFRHAMFACWKEIMFELRRVRQIAYHLEDAQEKHAYSMDRAMLLWGDKDRDIVLHTVLHVWHEDIANDKFAAAEEDRLAREQRAKEIYDEQVGGVLLMLEAGNKDFVQQYYFRAWSDYITEKKHNDRHAFYQKLHSNKMQLSMIRYCDSDDGIFMHAMFATWKEIMFEIRKIKHTAEHLQAAQERHAHSMDRALMIWGDGEKDVVLHSIMHAWHEDVRDEKEMQARLDEEARMAAVKDIYDHRVSEVFLMMESDNAGFLTLYYFRAWLDLYQERHLNTQAAWYKNMHSHKMQVAMRRFADGDETSYLHVCFAGWKEIQADLKRMKQIKQHLQDQKELHDYSMERALLLWGDHDNMIVLHTMLHAWYEIIDDLKAAEMEAHREEMRRKAKEMYNQRVTKALLLMESDNASFTLLAFFHGWQDIWEDTVAARKASFVKKLHSGNMQKVLAMTASLEDGTYVHVLFQGWKEIIWELKRLQQIRQHLDHQKGQHDRSMDRALMLWGDNNMQIVLHTIMHAWFQDLCDEKDLIEEAERLAEARRAKELYDKKVMNVLMKWESDNADFIQEAVFRTWLDLMQDARLAHMGFKNDQLSAKADYMRALHKGPVRKALYNLADVNDNLNMKNCFGVWHEYVLDQSHMKKTAKRLKEKEEKHKNVVEKSLIEWAGTESILGLHTVLHVWLMDVQEERENRLKGSHARSLTVKKLQYKDNIQFALGKLAQGDAHSWLHAVFQGWHYANQDGRSLATMKQLDTQLNHMRRLWEGPVHDVVGRLLKEGYRTITMSLFARWREAVAEQRLMRLSRSTVKATKGQHNLVLDRAAMTWLGSNDQLNKTLTIHAWKRVTLDAHVFKTRANLQKMTNQAERLKHVNKVGVGQVVMKAAFMTDSIRVQAVFACLKALVQDSRHDKKTNYLLDRMDRAHLSLYNTALCTQRRRAFLAWRYELAKLHQENMADLKGQLSSKDDDVKKLQKRLAGSMLYAEHQIEEHTKHNFHLGSAIDELTGHLDRHHNAISTMEEELDKWKAQMQAPFKNKKGIKSR